jgi:large subunit ribosomal protein L16
MLMMPKKVKFRKQQRGRRRGVSWRCSHVSYGDFGAKTLDAAWITARQIEAARVTISRYIKKGGKMWSRLYPDKPITKKPLETRMGSGKGAPEEWVAVVKPGRILFEVEGISEAEAREAFKMAGYKLPIRVAFAKRTDF